MITTPGTVAHPDGPGAYREYSRRGARVQVLVAWLVYPSRAQDRPIYLVQYCALLTGTAAHDLLLREHIYYYTVFNGMRNMMRGLRLTRKEKYCRQNHVLISLECLDPGSGRTIPARWHGVGAYPRVFIRETLF